jgi:hypothetical protein
MVERVVATEGALALIERLRAQHGDLMFFQSGGCCDGSAPNCYPKAEFQVSRWDVLLGEIGDCPYYVSKTHFEYSANTQLIIDVLPGRGGDFSLEAPEGVCFHARTRLYTDEEWQSLPPISGLV